MATFEALYIADSNGSQVFEYPVSPSPPNFKTLISHIISPLLLSTKEVINPIIELGSSQLLFHQTYNDLIFLLPCSADISSLVPSEFIKRFIRILEEFFKGSVTMIKIRSNYDIITMMVNEMLDGGYPFQTESNTVQQLVPSYGVLSKILSGPANSNQTLVNSDLPWRRANVRHTKNELLVDITETLYAIIPPTIGGIKGLGLTGERSASEFLTYTGSVSQKMSSQPIISRVEGTIFVKCYISGIPEILVDLNLNNKATVKMGQNKKSLPDLKTPSFHPCVKINKWKERPGALSFIPPDGRSLIASYSVENIPTSAYLVNCELRTGIGSEGDEFEVRVWTTISRETKSISMLSLEVVCDNEKVLNIKTLQATAGNFNYEGHGTGTWAFDRETPLGWSATFRGSVVRSIDEDEYEDDENRNNADNQSNQHRIAEVQDNNSNGKQRKSKNLLFPRHVAVSYNCEGHLPSRIKVDTVRIISSRGMGEGVKPYKGVKYSTKIGEYIVR
ncbi:clathrin adaptor, mu subunit [Nadsonia fulvescens var. elongata DSM 6958]|uniref:Clathrin adaptor, mu subunit n=1 Tax=Nadsonia fulvescens var. elongata DSM 6958 TaxID=857566 RepID=A0A1E3PSM1_9ASCO|nr:clathrin adaptor, mu subunit [Nadsonia fulvescens var. elongata DSM 6958]